MEPKNLEKKDEINKHRDTNDDTVDDSDVPEIVPYRSKHLTGKHNFMRSGKSPERLSDSSDSDSVLIQCVPIRDRSSTTLTESVERRARLNSNSSRNSTLAKRQLYSEEKRYDNVHNSSTESLSIISSEFEKKLKDP
ncbi:hypothetical protein Bhyg_16184 [Pseudolycoriella hygida]|uniref:Uncharacterized protein n=1 Tax=Pseudolycoriella hygida TaxID=35572 RepID=A0A9Q0MLJ7_9DIPT|nr:hypothetical protein Bhyg_16184 [Pseudolycoriella hygida]